MQLLGREEGRLRNVKEFIIFGWQNETDLQLHIAHSL